MAKYLRIDDFMAVLALTMATFTAMPLLPAAKEVYLIRPTVNASFPQPSTFCLTLNQYATMNRSVLPWTTLELLPGVHSLSHDIDVRNITNFAMLGNPHSQQPKEPATVVSCDAPVSFSFHDSRNVKIQGNEFVQCGDVHQPAIRVDSVQHFQMGECVMRSSGGKGVIVNQTNLTVQNSSFHNSSDTGLTVINGLAGLSGHNTFQNNGNMSSIQELIGTQCLPENFTPGCGGLTAINSSIDFLGVTTFLENHADLGGGVYAQNSILAFPGHHIWEDNKAVFGGGAYAVKSTLKCHHNPASVSSRSEHLKGFQMDIDFTLNRAWCNGGGLFITHSTLTCNTSIRFALQKAWLGSGVAASYSYCRKQHCPGRWWHKHKKNTLICKSTTVFESNCASWNGGAMVSISSVVKFVDHADFKANSAIDGGGIDMKSSSLVTNGSVVFDGNTASINFGGGINAHHNSTLLFGGTTVFIANIAPAGGGMAAHNSRLCFNGSIDFTNNMAEDYGGGLYVIASRMSFNSETIFEANTAGRAAGGMWVTDTNSTFHGRTLFDANTAEYGGGMLVSSSEEYQSTFCSKILSIVDPTHTTCTSDISARNVSVFKQVVTFTSNRARFGAGIMLLYGGIHFAGQTQLHNNTAILPSGDDATYGFGGGIFFYSSHLTFSGDTTLTENTAMDGGGIHGSRSVVVVSGTLTAVDNLAGASGEGIYFTSGTECWVLHSSSVVLARNHAGKFGGAIYVQDDPYFYCINRDVKIGNYWVSCIFQPTMWPTNATVRVLDDNYAGEAGSGIYGGQMEQCKIQAWNTLLHDSQEGTAALQWIFQSKHRVPLVDNSTPSLIGNCLFISSDPLLVCLCIDDTPHCNVREIEVSAYPGATFHVSVVAVGQRNGTVPSVITGTNDNEEIVIDSHQRFQFANKTCTTLEYRILPKLEHNSSSKSFLMLNSEAICQSYRTPLTILISLLPCPKGFELSNAPYQTCICSNRIQKYTNTCNVDDHTISYHGRYWIGWDSRSDGAILHPHCPFDYCTSGNMSFAMNDTDQECQINRAGLLCGGCKKGHSIVLGSSRCLQCSDNSHISLVLTFALAGIVLVIFLLFFKLTVALGTINGLVLYANIVARQHALYFPSCDSRGTFLKVFIAWINLDFGIETCFYDGMDMYTL